MTHNTLKKTESPLPQENRISQKKKVQISAIKKSPSTSSKILYYYAKFMTVVGILGQSLFYLQAFKILKQGRAEDVSLEGFLISLFSLTCWLIYGLLIKDKVLVIVNIFGVAGAALTTFSIFFVQ